MTTIKQKIRTIDAKALFRCCPKKNGSKYYALPLNSKAICRRVIKQEENMEDCPVFDQFYKEIEKRTDGEGTFVVTDTTLTDKFLVMDFDDIFMPCSEDAKEPAKEKKKLLQENVKDIIENGFDIYPALIPLGMAAVCAAMEVFGLKLSSRAILKKLCDAFGETGALPLHRR